MPVTPDDPDQHSGSTEPIEPTDADPVLTMTGDVDIATETDWLRRGTDLLAAHPDVRDLTVDMRDVGFLDSRGMAVLVALHSAALQRGGRLSLRAVPRRVQKALHVAGLDSVFDVAAS